MGACFSSPKPKSTAKPTTATEAHHHLCRDPPPDPDVEETVKEVLSETPLPFDATTVTFKPLKPSSTLFTDDRSDDFSESNATSVLSYCDALYASTADKPPTQQLKPAVDHKPDRKTRDLEQSPAKAKPMWAPGHQRKRSVSGDFSCRRERSVAVGCAAARSSPVKRRSGGGAPELPVPRTRSSREPSPAPRRVLSGGVRRDLGERSGRRSVSPAGKRVAELRQAGAAGQQQCRASPNRVMVDGGGEDGEKKVGTMEGEDVMDNNPLVSLECFIFL